MPLVTNTNRRIFGLDIVRAVAITMVLSAHFGVFLDRSIGKFTEPFGQMGVEIFFVLSGYLIGRIFFDMYYEHEGFSFSLLLKFWCRRWLRTLPNYYLYLTGFLLCAVAFDVQFGNAFRYFFFIQNFSLPTPDLFAGSWSLSFEEWFYLLFPFFVFVFTKVSGSKNRSPMLAAFVIGATSIILRNHLPDRILARLDTMPHIVIYRLDSMMAGILIAVIYRQFPELWLRLKSAWTIGTAGLIAFYLWILFGWPRPPNLQLTLDLNFYYLAIDCAAALTIPYFSFMVSSKYLKGYVSRAIVNVSKWSYSLYLCHMLVQLFLRCVADKYNFDVKNVMLPVGLPLSFIISSVTYSRFEKPIMDLRNRIDFLKGVA